MARNPLTPEVINQSNAASGITISPFFSEVTVTVDNPSVSATITLYNGSSEELHLSSQVRPLSQINAAASNLAGSDTVAWLNAISLDASSFTIPPRTNREVTITARQHPVMRQGGNYAVITFHNESDPASGTNALGLSKDVNALMFVINDMGQLQRQLTLQPPKLPIVRVGLPSDIVLPFLNEGNVHIRPFGEVLFTADNVTYAKGIINQDSRLVLPQNELELTVPLTKKEIPWWPQSYSVLTHYRADQDDPETYTDQLVIVPPVFVYGLLALLFVIWYIRRAIKRRVSK